MDLMLLRVFQRQVETQSRYALMSFAVAEKAINEGRLMSTELWYGIEGLLTSAANIQKALWGTGGNLATEREPLRDSLSVDDSSPLRATEMRNNFEHFDERVDRWWTESSQHNFIDMNIGDIVGGISPPPAEIDMFRNLDLDRWRLTFWGDTFDIQEIVAEIRRIMPIVTEEAAKPHWENPQTWEGDSASPSGSGQ